LEATIREWLKLAIARPDNRPLCFKGYKEKKRKKKEITTLNPTFVTNKN
jgi:hypothetical protein